MGHRTARASPFSHDIELEDAPVTAGDMASTAHSLPSVLPRFRQRHIYPARLGLNHTVFFEEDASADLNLALDDILSQPAGTTDATLDLDNSTGIAAQIGLDYMISENILINGTIWWIDIDTQANIYTADATVNFDVDIDPFVYFLSVGYRF